jgi:hypothetical protein
MKPFVSSSERLEANCSEKLRDAESDKMAEGRKPLVEMKMLESERRTEAKKRGEAVRTLESSSERLIPKGSESWRDAESDRPEERMN